MLQNLKKLKIKITAINIIAMSIILVIIFTLLYFFFESALKGQERTLLYYSARKESIPTEEEERAPVILGGVTVEEAEALMLFSVATDLSGRIFYTANYLVKPDFVENLLETVDSLAYDGEVLEKERGDVQFYDLKFAYLVSPQNNGVIYAFISTEYRDNMLRLYIILSVGGLIVSLVAVFFISAYLAGKAIAPIRDSMEKQEKFIADASHELRTPLAVIRSNVEMIIDAPQLTVEENMKWLEYILKESKRMAKMTQDLLFLGKADIAQKNKRTLDVQKEKVNLSVLVLEVYDSFMKLFEENGLYDNNCIIAQDICIYADENRIRQLVTVLLDNAIKYTKEGGITIELEHDAEFAYIKVSDTGQGIPEDMLEKIFERFVRTDKARSRAAGGAGLGLSIAKTIAEEHGGKISVESEVGKGSVFCVKLPLVII